ncbi:hypothetical protein [Spiroplasma cantharicola]|uniref:Major facilitator superfamily (MFS) profile domain-containing protein n=1 Tax=Spiroplasma cantharicola TaxID=362837 RepID=A0A0M4KDW9_9MOLU|nr:hypothetical protein [Spiroplasma cantharicola]ALD66057.1 hypothetical protein SCANT_v1c01470 [Spiroplasma cantharicola]
MNRNISNKILDLTSSAMMISLAMCLKLIFSPLPGVDLTLLIILLTGLFLKSNISILSTIGISLLSLLMPVDIILSICTITIYLLFNISLVIFKYFLLRNKIVIYVMAPISALMITSLYLLVSIFTYGRTEGYSLYLTHLHEAYIIFFMYCLITPFLLKQFENLLIKIEGRYSSIYNKSFKKYIEESESNILKISDKKINYNIQLASMIISMMILISYFSFVPYKMVTKFEDINYLAAIIIVPILMLFVTPTWIKLAKKIGNLKVLKINSIGLLFALICTFSSFETNNLSLANGLLFTGLILFGIFVAGLLPINIEIIKSYERRNSLKNKTAKYNSIYGFLLLPIPFLMDYYSKSLYILFLFLIVMIILICLFIFNQNIMSDGNVLNINKDSFKTLKTNKKFFIEIFIQNYFIGFFKFLDWSLVLFFFLKFENNKIIITTQINETSLILFLIFGFISKYFAQAIFGNIKFKNNNVNRIAMFLTLISVTAFISFLISSYYINYSNMNNIYYSILLILMFIFGTAYALIEKTKAKRFKSIVSDDEFSLAMIIDHVMGNAFFSLIIASIFFIIILLTQASLLAMIILMSSFVIIGSILLVTNSLLKNKQKENI